MEWDKPFFLFQRNKSPVGKHIAHGCCWCEVIVDLDTLPASRLTGKEQQRKCEILGLLITISVYLGYLLYLSCCKVLVHVWISTTVLSSKSLYFTLVGEVSYAVFQCRALICNSSRTSHEIWFIKHLHGHKKMTGVTIWCRGRQRSTWHETSSFDSKAAL